MKVRNDFVTNSSSSSYIVIQKVEFSDELLKYMAEEYGKYGLRLMKECIAPGMDIEKWLEDYDIYVDDFLEDNEIDPEGHYLFASRESYSDEGCIEGDDAWLMDHIPGKYATEIYRGGGY